MLHKLPGVNSVIFFGMVLALLSKWQRSSIEWSRFLPSYPVLFLIFFWFPNNQSSQPQMVSGGWHHADPDISPSSDPCQLPRTFASTSLLISTTTSTTIKVIHLLLLLLHAMWTPSSYPPLHPSHSSQLNPGISQSHSFFELSWSMISYPPSLPSHNYLSTSFLTHLPHPQQPGGDSFLPLSMVGRHQAGRWQKQVTFLKYSCGDTRRFF